MTLSFTRDTVGTLARSVGDAILLDQLVTGEPTGAIDLTGCRLGVSVPYFYDDLEEEVRPVIDCALGRLSDVGAELVETEIHGLAELVAAFSLDLTLS